MVMVGAFNVTRIQITDKQDLKMGDELGYFNLGSTIVMLIETKNVK
jgi:phosphatidylserine decarboxylase